jgi:hypothetical protein
MLNVGWVSNRYNSWDIQVPVSCLNVSKLIGLNSTEYGKRPRYDPMVKML